MRTRADSVGTASAVESDTVELNSDALITGAAPQPAAAGVVREPGQDRRPDLPGVRPRRPDAPAIRAGNPPEARRPACASVPGAVALPGCEPPPSQPHG